MKRTINTFLVFTIALVFSTVSTQAQDITEEEFFLGKWKIMASELPQGDTEMIFVIEKKDGKLGGQMEAGGETVLFTKIESGENKITIYFNSQGFDVYNVLEKVDEDNVKGTMMDMFNLEGTRIDE